MNIQANHPPANPPPSLLGELLVSDGIITTSQLHAALAWQQRHGGRLGEALIALGLVAADQLESILTKQRRKIPIGELLVRQGVLSRGELAAGLAEQARTGVKLGEALVALGFISEEGFTQLLAHHLELPYLSLRHHPLPPEATKLLPEAAARRLRAVVLAAGAGTTLVGVVDPTDLFTYDELVGILGGPVLEVLVTASELTVALDRIYRGGHGIDGAVEDLAEEVERDGYNLEQMVSKQMLTDAPVARILQGLFENALRSGASDIHIEPDEGVLRIRQRVDGVLQERLIKEWQIAPALVSKLKLMAGLEIAERRVPQDGRFKITVGKKNIVVRLATLPVQDGEAVVLRLLDQSAHHLKLEGTGLSKSVLTRLRMLSARVHGLILVTGPTGCGKTTTLYGLLAEINEPGRKIVTVEDPVEYRLPRVSQVQVKPRIQLTFARALRHILRQDPDVILVGEMRDRETAETAISASLTGHLVFSTLHTRDAVGCVIRLLDLGVAGYAVASSLLGVLSQRLVRRVCGGCAEPHQPDLSTIPGDYQGLTGNDSRWLRPRGCSHCGHTGYRGRAAVAELLVMTPPLVQALRQNDVDTFTRLARREGQGLYPTALEYARLGITSLEEALRLNFELDEGGSGG